MIDYKHGDPTKTRRVAEHYLACTNSDAARLHRTASLAARAMDFPIGQINILDDRRAYTIGDYRSGATVGPRDQSMCQFVVDGCGQVLAVDDLRGEERFRRLPGVRDGSARSYLGVPLTSREATPVGALCLIDSEPRHITDSEIERIVEFGDIVQDQLDLLRRTPETAAARSTSALVADAIGAGQIEPWYQPIIDLDGERRSGFEALARWRRSDGSIVRPADFITVAEDSDLVIDLDRTIMRAAIRDLVRWRRTDPTLRMNVNLSTRHLELADGAAFVLGTAEEFGLDPAALTVEITETRSLTDARHGASTVWALQSAGVQVLLDDFGNGWSGLEWLLGLGADGLKIDRSVTAALGTPVGDAVSRAVVGMTAELGISTTIEGISEPAHLAAARAHGFQYGQGYLWSRPVPAVMIDATI